MASQLQMANLALLRLGSSAMIADMSESSNEARVMTALWDVERDTVLSELPWPFATGYVALGLVAGTSSVAVNDDWQYSYRYPSGCLKVRRITAAAMRRRPTDPPPFRVGRDGTGKLIYTNQADPVTVEYTVAVTAPGEFSAPFASMLAWRLAVMAAPALTRMPQAVTLANQFYQIERSAAMADALNEQQQEEQLDAESIRARS